MNALMNVCEKEINKNLTTNAIKIIELVADLFFESVKNRLAGNQRLSFVQLIDNARQSSKKRHKMSFHKTSRQKLINLRTRYIIELLLCIGTFNYMDGVYYIDFMFYKIFSMITISQKYSFSHAIELSNLYNMIKYCNIPFHYEVKINVKIEKKYVIPSMENAKLFLNELQLHYVTDDFIAMIQLYIINQRRSKYYEEFIENLIEWI